MHVESAIHKVAEPHDCHIRWWPVTSSKHVHELSRLFPIITANHLTSDPFNCFLSMQTVDMLKIEDQHRGQWGLKQPGFHWPNTTQPKTNNYTIAHRQKTAIVFQPLWEAYMHLKKAAFSEIWCLRDNIRLWHNENNVARGEKPGQNESVSVC